jgi:type VI secretion system secreted protein VgrG
MSDRPYALCLVGEPAPLRVLQYRAREALSAPYRVRVRCLAAEGSTPSGSSIGQAATLSTLLAGGQARRLHGVVTASRSMGVGTAGASIDLVVEPRLRRLSLRRRRRIFQDLTAVDVAMAVLGEHAVPCRAEVARRLPVRGYCVQLDESDLAFVERLLADEGVFYFFEHEGRDAQPRDPDPPVETMVLADAPQSYRRASPRDYLVHRDETGEGALHRADDTVFAPRLSRRVRGERIAVAGLDFARPGTAFADAAAVAPSGVGAPGAALERDTHELSYETAPVAPGPARVELEQERRDATLLDARTNARHLAPGSVFTLGESLDPELCADWVVVSVRHRGVVAHGGERVFECAFRAAPASTPYRPKRASKPVSHGVETATVEGPEGESVHTDSFGRVRVRFPWDRSGALGDRASTWLRVAQAWAGSGFGAQFIPRVGSEVLVGFVGGDPDRPIVVGGLYDGTRPHPFMLPRDKTQSGFRTSTIGGHGHNELSFEDREGGELVSIHGQRNVAVQALADYARTVGGSSRVGIEGKSELTVGGDRNETVAGTRRSTVTGALLEETGPATVLRNGPQILHVQGDRIESASGGLQLRAGSFLEVLAGTGGAAYANVTVQGTSSTRSTDTMFLGSNTSITLGVGDSKIVVGPSSVTITTPELRVDAPKIGLYGKDVKEFVEIGGGVRVNADTVSAFASGSTLNLDANAELKGAQVKLSSGKDTASAPPPPASDETGLVTFKIENFDASKSCTMLVMMPTGEVVEKTPDGSGTLQIEGRPGERFSVIDVRYDGLSVAKTRT